MSKACSKYFPPWNQKSVQNADNADAQIWSLYTARFLLAS